MFVLFLFSYKNLLGIYKIIDLILLCDNVQWVLYLHIVRDNIYLIESTLMIIASN